MQKRIGEILINSGLITHEQLSVALKLKLSKKKRIGEILVELGYMTAEQVVKTLYEQLSDKINNVLQNMAEAELTMTEFYTACSKVFSHEKDFWLDMANDEIKHAENINEMINVIYRKPHLFEEGLKFQVGLIKTFIDGIKSAIQKIKNGELPSDKMVFIARDFENSSIEMKYYEVLKTDDEEYNAFVRKIISQDIGHRTKLDKKIEDMKRKIDSKVE